MPLGVSGAGTEPLGTEQESEYQPTATVDVTQQYPVVDSTTAEPDSPVTFSVRDLDIQVTQLVVTIDNTLVYFNNQFQPGYSGSVVPNNFLGLDVVVNHPGWTLGSHHLVTVTATDAVGFTVTESWGFTTREACFDSVRFAIPRPAQDTDPATMAWLKIWDGILCFTRHETYDVVKDSGLFDVDKIPASILPVAFEDAALVFPNFNGVSTERQRRLLKNADKIHATRYSAEGLQFYISLLTDALVVVTKLNRGKFLFFNSETFGFPTPAMMVSSNTDNDVCTYFIGPYPKTVKVTITGILTEEMKTFLRETIFREIPLSDDPQNPLDIQIEFLQ